jgi:hypothetical protein
MKERTVIVALAPSTLMISAEARKSKSGPPADIDISNDLARIEGGKVPMKGFFKFMLAVLTLGAAFVLGLHLGKEKEKSKIPIFQEDPDHGE